MTNVKYATVLHQTSVEQTTDFEQPFQKEEKVSPFFSLEKLHRFLFLFGFDQILKLNCLLIVEGRGA